jgi:hypothetical protein
MACARRGDESASWADKRPIRVGGTAARNRTAQQRAPRLGGYGPGKWKSASTVGSARTLQDVGRGERLGETRGFPFWAGLCVGLAWAVGVWGEEEEEAKEKRERRRGKGEEVKEKR